MNDDVLIRVEGVSKKLSDLADAHVLALRSLQAGGAGAAYNPGNGQGFSVQEVIALAHAITVREIPVILGPRRPGDPPRLVADASRARQALAACRAFGSNWLINKDFMFIMSEK